MQVYQFPQDQQKTGQNIRQSLTMMGNMLGIKDLAARFYFVTDQGSNIQSALALGSGFNRLPCACHCLATALRHALPDGPGDKGDSDELQDLRCNISSAKALVQYFKKSGLNAMLEKTLVQENDTRWNTMLMMLQSVVNQESAIRDFLQRKDEAHRIDSINIGLLKDVVQFLTPLKEATKALEGDTYPTIHRVCLYYHRLLRHMQPQFGDSPVIEQLKRRLSASLQSKWQLTTMHKLALFLHPQYKALRKMEEQERRDVHSLARQLIRALPEPVENEERFVCFTVMILAGVFLLYICLSQSYVFVWCACLFFCFFIYIYNIISSVCYYRWPALMGLGPSGSLPHCYIVFYYSCFILAINSVCVCVCVLISFVFIARFCRSCDVHALVYRLFYSSFITVFIVVHSTDDMNQATKSSGDHDAYMANPAKHRRVTLDEEFENWKDDMLNDNNNKDDIDRYIDMTFSDAQTNSFSRVVDGEAVFDVATFWYSKQMRDLCPQLSRAAVGVLSIPSSSASSERVFSTTGRILEKRHTQLSQQSVDALVYLHSKYHA